jgi:PKD repeat protein
VKNIFTTLSIMLLGMGAANAQGFSCTAGEKSIEQYAKHPELMVAKDQLEAYTREYIRNNQGRNQSSRSGLKVIPVVFHILHDAGTEMISDSVVFTEMIHWNEYMNATNPEILAGQVVPAFDTLIGNPNIEFRLAQRDPQGNCTNGIDRIYTQATYVGNNNTKLRPWPREKYLNVWLTRAIERDATQYGTLAYSMYPSSVATYYNNEIIDGIIAKYFVVGGNVRFSRPTLAHECGHWLNLKHVWGDTNSPGVACGDDDVPDTPITKGDQNTCLVTKHQCVDSIVENVQNIMNYAECHFMFTPGQVARMNAALASPIAGRNYIDSSINLIATGTDQPIDYFNTTSPCATPIADFAVDKRYICVGQNVKFTDASYNSDVNARQWTFPADAIFPGSSTDVDAKPVVQFTTSGWKEVTLTVTSANGNIGRSTKTMVYVSDPSDVIAAPYLETFEDPTASAKWLSLNYDNNNTSFQRYSQAGHYSQNCFKLNYYDSKYEGDKDELASPMFDLSNIPTSDMKLSFEYSYATADAAHLTDSFATISAYGSIDCGKTWTRIYYKIGYGLFNAGFQLGGYVPGQDNQYWKKITINLPTAYQISGVMFKFSVNSIMDLNHFYIDNINVGKAIDRTGVEDINQVNIASIDVVPNPVSDNASLVIDATGSAKVSAVLYDLQGREISTIFNDRVDAGTQKVDFSTESLATGVYVVRVTDGKVSQQKKFIKL